MAWASYHGRVSVKPNDAGSSAYLELQAAGYRIRVLLNGKEVDNVLLADTDQGIVVISHVTGFAVTAEERRGKVEIQIAKWGTK